MRGKRTKIICMLGALIFYALLAVVVVELVRRSGVWPAGEDTLYHVYRGDQVYRSILRGNGWLLYDPAWYNGVELLRYEAPIAPYVMAACEALAGGNPLDGYLLFVGVICFVGALPWLYIGCRIERPWLGAFLGALWFFMPNNLRTLFTEGDLPRVLGMMFLPLLLYGIYRYQERQGRRHLLLLILTFALMVLCDLNGACMIAIAVLLYLALSAMQNGLHHGALEIMVAMLIGVLLSGIWLYPYLIGGVTAVDSSENMQNFFQNLWVTLNPLDRLENGSANYYFGLAALLLAVFGGFLSYRRQRPGFWTGLLLVLGTALSAYSVLCLLPGGRYLWMLRFLSIALGMILCAFLFWDTLRKPLVLLFCLLLAVDVIPSLGEVYGTRSGESAAERLEAQQEETLIAVARQITQQRMALLDLSSLGATGAWLASGGSDGVAATFGAGWEAAETSSNIAQLNRAFSGGQYAYLFDRCLELGNDTVLIRMAQIGTEKEQTAAVAQLDECAGLVGYQLADANDGYRLYHLDVAGNWGTISTYRAIGIGTMAAQLSLYFPAIEETASTNLNDYTFEELAQYDIIYLSGFTWDDRAEAEALILRLSESGVRIVIEADGIPDDASSRDQSFLGVTRNAVTFSNGYPDLETADGLLDTDLFPPGDTQWETVYLEGLDEVRGTVLDQGMKLPFYGTVKNENIVMIGLNLAYFYALTGDASAEKILSEAMELPVGELPVRRIVPVELTATDDTITAVVPEDEQEVNLTLAYHELFDSDRTLTAKNHLLYVAGGTTVIRFRYPWLGPGVCVSLLGLVLAGILLVEKRCGIKSAPVIK